MNRYEGHDWTTGEIITEAALDNLSASLKQVSDYLYDSLLPEVFDNEKNYNSGDYFINDLDGHVYQFNDDHSAGDLGPNEATIIPKATEILDNINNNLKNLENISGIHQSTTLLFSDLDLQYGTRISDKTIKNNNTNNNKNRVTLKNLRTYDRELAQITIKVEPSLSDQGYSWFAFIFKDTEITRFPLGNGSSYTDNTTNTINIPVGWSVGINFERNGGSSQITMQLVRNHFICILHIGPVFDKTSNMLISDLKNNLANLANLIIHLDYNYNKSIANSVSYDNILEAGTYTGNINNQPLPTLLPHTLIVNVIGNNTITQIIIDVAGKIYTRGKNSNNDWSEWIDLLSLVIANTNRINNNDLAILLNSSKINGIDLSIYLPETTIETVLTPGSISDDGNYSVGDDNKFLPNRRCTLESYPCSYGATITYDPLYQISLVFYADFSATSIGITGWIKNTNTYTITPAQLVKRSGETEYKPAKYFRVRMKKSDGSDFEDNENPTLTLTYHPERLDTIKKDLQKVKEALTLKVSPKWTRLMLQKEGDNWVRTSSNNRCVSSRIPYVSGTTITAGNDITFRIGIEQNNKAIGWFSPQWVTSFTLPNKFCDYYYINAGKDPELTIPMVEQNISISNNNSLFASVANFEDIVELESAAQTTQTAVEGLSTRMTTAEGDIDTLESAVGNSGLGGRMTTAEGNITTLGTRMTTAEGDVTALGGRMTNAEGDISNLNNNTNNLINGTLKPFEGSAATLNDAIPGTLLSNINVGINKPGSSINVNTISSSRLTNICNQIIFYKATPVYQEKLLIGGLSVSAGTENSDKALVRTGYIDASVFPIENIVNIIGLQDSNFRLYSSHRYTYNDVEGYVQTSGNATGVDSLPRKLNITGDPGTYVRLTFMSVPKKDLSNLDLTMVITSMSNEEKSEYSLGSNIYGGNLIFDTGTLIQTHAMVELNNSNVEYIGDNTFKVIGISPANETLVSNQLYYADGERTDRICWLEPNGNDFEIRFKVLEISSVSDLINYYTARPIQIVYRLITPTLTTIPLSAPSLAITEGTNYFWVNTNQFSFNYKSYIYNDINTIKNNIINIATNINNLESFTNINDPITCLLPSTIRVCATREMNIYYQNCIRYFNTKLAQKFTVNGKFTNYLYFARYTPASNAKYDNKSNSTISFFKSNTFTPLLSKTIKVETIPMNTGNVTKKIIFIGDSITANGTYLTELLNLFTNDNMSINILGNANTSEGHSGWRAYTYCRCANYGDDVNTFSTSDPSQDNIINPFYDNGHFNFTKYMTDQNYDSVNYVFICLGTNDIVRYNNQTDALLKLFYDEMITSIHNYNSNIRIALWLPPIRALYQNAQHASFDAALRMHEFFINNYDNREDEKIYLCPVYLNIDPYHDYPSQTEPISSRNTNITYDHCTDGTHPATVGYYKIADVIYSLIKYFAYLDNQQ